MQRPKQIFYIGTYEREYPRNVITIAALRRAGFAVLELHEKVWPEVTDKSGLVDSPLALMALGIRLVSAYTRLLFRLLRFSRHGDLYVFGYIGQIDVLFLGPLVRLFRKPILFNPLITLTDTLIEDRQRVGIRGVMPRLISLVDSLSLKLCDAILVDTQANGQYLVSVFQVPPSVVRILPVGADEAVFSPTQVEACDSVQSIGQTGVLRILFYGKMIPLQGVETIVRAAKLLENQLDMHFDIVGTGQVYSAVRSLAEALALTNINFVDHVDYDALPRIISDSDIILGIFGATDKAARVVPNKVFQAMAMGAAIITRDSPAARDVLRDGESALLIPPNDPAALAQAIQRLRVPSLRLRLGAAARARFLAVASLDVQSACLAEVVDSMLSGSSVPRREITA